MKVNHHYYPSFGAKFINKINIEKIEPNKKYLNTEVNFVEIEPDNYNDILALKNCSNTWKRQQYADSILNAAEKMHKKCKYYENGKIYALTAQTDNFKKLKSEDILGLTYISTLAQNFSYINFIQVNPEHIYSQQPKYLGIGTAILNSLKRLNHTLKLISKNDDKVIRFYEKNNFIKDDGYTHHYTWVRELFESF